MKLFPKIALIISLLTGAAPMTESKELATFAGGCFWCMHAEFASINGVSKVVSGYIGGHTKNPTYDEISTGKTGHLEAIEVTFDESKVTYERLLEIFWENIDPLDEYGQFCDKGSQYRAGIFYHDEEQKKLATDSKAKLKDKLKQEIATIIEPATKFYEAEDYHQDFYIKNKIRYKQYKLGCGRDDRLKELREEYK